MIFTEKRFAVNPTAQCTNDNALPIEEYAMSSDILLMNRQTTDTLAAAIITASGRAWSIAEAIEPHASVHFAMHPDSGGRYKAWAESKDEHLAKVWK